MADFVISSWNGKVNCHIDHIGTKRRQDPFGRERRRLVIGGTLVTKLSFDELKMIFDPEIKAVEEEIRKEQSNEIS